MKHEATISRTRPALGTDTIRFPPPTTLNRYASRTTKYTLQSTNQMKTWGSRTRRKRSLADRPEPPRIESRAAAIPFRKAWHKGRRKKNGTVNGGSAKRGPRNARGPSTWSSANDAIIDAITNKYRAMSVLMCREGGALS